MSSRKNAPNDLIVDFDKLPFTADLSKSRQHLLTYLYFAIGCLALGFMAASPFLGVIGSLLFIRVFAVYTEIDQVVFYEDHLIITRDSLTQTKRVYTVPYKDFKGLKLGQIFVRHGRYHRMQQTITLAHETAYLSVLLYNQEGDTPPRTLWKDYALQLGLPILEQDGSTSKVTAPEEIGQTLRQRHQAKLSPAPLNSARHNNKDIAANVKPNRAPDLQTYGFVSVPPMNDLPEQLELITPKNNKAWPVKFQIKADRMNWYGKILILLISLGAIGMSVYLDEDYFVTILGIAGVLWILFIIIIDLTILRELVIDRHKIMLHDIWPMAKNDNTVKKLALDEVETILIQGQNNLTKTIVIQGKSGEINLGKGLSPKALSWLQDYLRKVVVSA